MKKVKETKVYHMLIGKNPKHVQPDLFKQFRKLHENNGAFYSIMESL